MTPAWTPEEEEVFSAVQRVSRLSRIESIHLWKRCGRDAKKAIAIAERDYPAWTEAQLALFSKAGKASAAARAARAGISA